MKTPAWYAAAESFLEDQGWPVMGGLAALIIIVTLYLVLTKKAVPLAVWLTYLYMP